MGGVEIKITQGRVTEKINCANPKDNHGLTFIKKQCDIVSIIFILYSFILALRKVHVNFNAINSHLSLLDSFAIKQAHTVF